MTIKKWRVAEYDKTLAKELAYECDVDPIVALIASARGYTDPMELEQFLSDEPQFCDPSQMADIKIAADIVNAFIEDNEKIAVFGDYDCDGVAATSLLLTYLKKRGANCTYYIPDRFSEGYGMNCDAVKFLHSQGVKLILTVDNGIVSFEEIALANSLGVTVVVTDHHLPDDTLPDAAAVVNPHRSDCQSAFKEICGAQVAFALMCVMENKEPEEMIYEYADILSLAVISDVMPLTAENRTVVKIGVEKIKKDARVGIAAILSAAGIDRATIDASKVTFGVTPRINAAGRIGSAKDAVELLCCDNMMTALNLATDIDNKNAQRQNLERKILEEAVNIIERDKLMHDRIIVVCGDNWHHGVLGIAASRITEKYGVPCIMLSSEGDIASGSGRSVGEFSLYDAIDSCRDLMIKFGGHTKAAGVTLKREDVPTLRRRINEYARGVAAPIPELVIDCKLKPAAINLDLAFTLKQLAPFGEGNRIPLFGIFGVKLEKITPIANNKHLRLLFSKENSYFQCMLFGASTETLPYEVGDILDLAVNVDSNCYKGEYSVTVTLRALRMDGTNDESIFSDKFAYSDFSAGFDTDFAAILPTREEVGGVYKFICEKPVLFDRVLSIYTNKIGYGKTQVALKTLEELGLIALDKSGKLISCPSVQKTNLLNSKTFKTLTERSVNCD